MAHNTFGLKYNKTTRSYECIDGSDKPFDREAWLRRKKLLQMQEREAKEQYERDHAHGYCPHCYCLLRYNGLCDNGCLDDEE